MKPYLIAIFMLCMQSCIFSNNDFVETDIGGGFKILSTPDCKNLVFKRPDEDTHTIIISENVDSIAWDDTFIYGYANKKYFVINQVNKGVSWFSDYSELIKKIEPLSNTKLKSTESL